MRVREIAKRVAVRPQVIRYYTRLGLLCPARDSRNGYNTYSDSEVIRLRFIHQAQSLGFTLSDIAQIFEDGSRRESPCPSVRATLERRIRENKMRLEKLTLLQQRMERALILWSSMPDCVPNDESICPLIESAGECLT